MTKYGKIDDAYGWAESIAIVDSLKQTKLIRDDNCS